VVSKLSEAKKISEDDAERIKKETMRALNLDLLSRIWKGVAREEMVSIEGEQRDIYHLLREVGLTPGAGTKYLPEPGIKLPALFGFLEEKIAAKTS